MYITELGAGLTLLDRDDRVIQKIPGGQRVPGEILKPHGIWGDSQGSLYVAEVEYGHLVQARTACGRRQYIPFAASGKGAPYFFAYSATMRAASSASGTRPST